jgi:hypothetical protein
MAISYKGWMDLKQALDSYRQDRFTDRDVMHCAQLSLRGWRALLETGAVNTVAERRGRGRIRLCDSTALKRAAVIAAISRAGFSLPVSGQIAYFMPFHTLMFTVYDPVTILLDPSADVTPATPFPQIDRPSVDWFDSKKPAKAEPRDWKIEIQEGRFVSAIYGATGNRVTFGDLRDQSTRFVAWYPSHDKAKVSGTAIEELVREALPNHRFVDFVVEFEDPTKWTKQLDELGYEFSKRTADDPLRIAAADTVRSPLFTTTINVSLAIRKALRRYLGMEAAEPSSDKAESI